MRDKMQRDAKHPCLAIGRRFAEGKCPHPEKAPFVGKRLAKKVAKETGLRPYKCVCGCYHLTSSGARIVSESEIEKMRFGNDS